MDTLFDWLYISDSIFRITMMIIISMACIKYIKEKSNG